jgi:hypothetical protein
MNNDATIHGPYLVPLLVIGLVALRLFRNKPRKVNTSRLFVLPVVLACGAAFTLAETSTPGLLWIVIYTVAAVLGAGVGYLSGRHREFTLDAESGKITGRATPIGTIIFGALFAARYGLKLAFPQLNGGGAPYGAMAHAHPAATAIGWTDAGLVFSAAMLLATAGTTWWRTRHLVAERKARAPSVGGSPPSE